MKASLLLLLLLVTACGPASEGSEPDTGPADTSTPDNTDTGPSDISGPGDVGDAGDVGDTDGCVPNCGGRNCGPDGCGGVCGDCDENEECDEGQCICAGETVAAFCTRHKVVCGELTASDLCGVARRVECPACPPGASCEAGQCVTCEGETDLEFCRARHQRCGELSGVDRCGLPREVRCADCDSPRSCDSNGECRAPGAPANDWCENAEAPAQLDGLSTHAGSNDGALDDYSGSCGGEGGGDVVYLLQLDEPTLLQVRLARRFSEETTFEPLFYLLKGCAEEREELACQLLVDESAMATFVDLQPATYFLVIDSATANSGQFALELFTSPARVDGCAEPRALTFESDTRRAHVEMTTSGARDDSRGPCDNSESSGGDLLYSLTVPPGSAMSLSLRLRPLGSNSRFSGTLYAGLACGGAELGCTRSRSPADRAMELRLSNLAPGTTLFLTVDSLSSGAEDLFQLDAALEESAPPSNDLCDNPLPLDVVEGTEPSAPRATIHANLSNRDATNQLYPYCITPTDSVETFYAFHTDRPYAMYARAVAATAELEFLPSISLLANCAADFVPGQCGGSIHGIGISSFSTYNLPAGEHLLVLDGISNTQGEVELFVEFYDAIDSRQCSDTEALALAEPPSALSFTTNTRAGIQVPQPRCISQVQRQMPTLTWKLTTPPWPTASNETPVEERFYRLDAQATPLYSPVRTSERVAPALVLATACDQSQVLACDKQSISAPLTLTALKLLPERTYYLFASNNQLNSDGAMELSLSLSIMENVELSDSCSSTIERVVLDPERRSGIVRGDTAGALNDFGATCAPANNAGADLVYVFSLPVEADVEVTVSAVAPTSENRYLLSLRESCEELATELACKSTVSPLSSIKIAPHRLRPFRDYYVIVDAAESAAKGRFDLTISYTPTTAPPPAFDTCETGATSLGFLQPNSSIVRQGSTEGAANDYRGSCESTARGTGLLHNGPDVVYVLTLAQRSRLEVTVTRDPSTPNYKPAVYVTTECFTPAPSGTVACAYDEGVGEQGNGMATAMAPDAEAGNYYIFVDGLNGQNGAYTLTAKSSAPLLDDRCGDELPTLTFQNGVAIVTGDTSTYGDDASPVACGDSGGSGKDLVYKLVTTGLGRSRVKATLAGQKSSTQLSSLYLRKECASTAFEDELACARSAKQVAFFDTVLAEGTYFLWVDGYNASSSGPFTLRVELGAPAAPQNDLLPVGQLDLSSGRATLTGSTVGAGNDLTRRCRNGGAAAYAVGPDVVYSFTLTGEATLSATATRDPLFSSFTPVVYFRSSLAPEVPDQALSSCEYANGQGLSHLRRLGAGTHYLVVDSIAANDTFHSNYAAGGAFTLEVTARTAEGAPESCASARQVTFTPSQLHFTIEENNGSAQNDTRGFGCARNLMGQDHVFALDTTAVGTRDLFAKVTYSTGGASRALALWSTYCEGAGAQDELACVEDGTLLLRAQPAGLYYLWVSATEAEQGGAYKLELSASAPISASCDAALPLTLDASGRATIIGSTQGAAPGAMAGQLGKVCLPPDTATSAADYSGPEAIYRIHWNSDKAMAISVKRLSGSGDPSLYVRAGTCASALPEDEVGCRRAETGKGTVATYTAPLVAGSDYYVVVDTTAASGLTFELTVAEVEPATRDCLEAQELQLPPEGALLRASYSTHGPAVGATAYGKLTINHGAAFRVRLPSSPAEQELSLMATPLGNFAASLSMGLASSCDEGSSALAGAGPLATGTVDVPVSLSARGLHGGATYVIRLGTPYTGMVGAFELSLIPSAPASVPANALCSSATPADVETGFARIAGLSFGGAVGAQSSSGCAQGSTGPELVYSIRPRAKAVLYAEMRPESGYTVSSIYMKSGCEAAGDFGACRASFDGKETARLTSPTLRAETTYYLFLDSMALHRHGTFSLGLKMTKTAPNDTCAGAIALERGQAVAADLREGTNDFGPGTGGSCGISGYGTQPDLVFLHRPTADGPFTVEANFVDLSNGVLWVGQGTCGSTSACVGVDSGFTSTPRRVTVNGTAGTNYYLYATTTSAPSLAYAMVAVTVLP